ncbi:hypothetical protein [Candidatus Berkiella aquae]|uniref:Uncharacterized protein n=1 Tax=Candidatus Berkiella aquae TaxID=295108 RepID=A0A0Q9YY73_9GAMM|nr:hypothetical protein [Candidatus Berkiella aquae]MCS5711561.1 hypothetical protein [Candidatus Berkiella aquae]
MYLINQSYLNKIVGGNTPAQTIGAHVSFVAGSGDLSNPYKICSFWFNVNNSTDPDIFNLPQVKSYIEKIQNIGLELGLFQVFIERDYA